MDSNSVSKILRAQEKLHELIDIHDNFFLISNVEKENILSQIVISIEDVLTNIQPDDSKIVDVYYIKGKAHDFSNSSYSVKAENFLNKAVKLDPTRANSWTALGVCLWKKGDKSAAISCFHESIKNQPNKEAFRELSILIRQPIKANIEDNNIVLCENILDSVKYAKKAIALDYDDQKSWYVLGNSLMSKYFNYEVHDMDDLRRGLSAYNRAIQLIEASSTRTTTTTTIAETITTTELTPSLRTSTILNSINQKQVNPDLYYNRGNILLYLQKYSLSLASYAIAAENDINLHSSCQTIIKNIQSLLAILYLFFTSRATQRVVISANKTVKWSTTKICEYIATKKSTTLTLKTWDSLSKSVFSVLVLIPLRTLIPDLSSQCTVHSYLCIDKNEEYLLLSIFIDSYRQGMLFNMYDEVEVRDAVLIEETCFCGDGKLLVLQILHVYSVQGLPSYNDNTASTAPGTSGNGNAAAEVKQVTMTSTTFAL